MAKGRYERGRRGLPGLFLAEGGDRLTLAVHAGNI